ncbi:hypothetical protein LEP1GSC172_2522 [Leptospira noguchii]|uniref:Uncharacterized protein n=1 Tax=Leptospira noguchii TaxID=28182 RepID=M6V4K0_9LEPT|nr:hypothetical protein LEP1GSC172_2522 [Leptospira noguchii]
MSFSRIDWYSTGVFQSTSFTNKGRNSTKNRRRAISQSWFQSTSFANKGRNKQSLTVMLTQIGFNPLPSQTKEEMAGSVRTPASSSIVSIHFLHKQRKK